ncbi:unnamed protein product [Owenia fusiformis]|uniref:Uncharacterized protein n=1 Tax=Owenia fusiformis TaxID=6347 RepID=A0A8S4N6E7_OWEFU|nr:unnamed protein product [Owenia fusiformis]
MRIAVIILIATCIAVTQARGRGRLFKYNKQEIGGRQKTPSNGRMPGKDMERPERPDSDTKSRNPGRKYKDRVRGDDRIETDSTYQTSHQHRPGHRTDTDSSASNGDSRPYRRGYHPRPRGHKRHSSESSSDSSESREDSVESGDAEIEKPDVKPEEPTSGEGPIESGSGDVMEEGMLP